MSKARAPLSRVPLQAIGGALRLSPVTMTQGGFPGAIWPEEGAALPRLDLQTDAVHRHETIAGLGQITFHRF
jgi:hypothetical protein